MFARLFTLLVGLLMLLGSGWLVLSATANSANPIGGERIPAQEGVPEEARPFLRVWTNTDFTKYDVDYSDIRSGGVPRDGIPPYYPVGYRYPDALAGNLGNAAPRYTVEYTSIEATNAYLPDEQQVIAVEINGEARAYPLLLLNNHEIANTEVGGVPIAVTFCPLCNASIVYEREVNGRELHFGVSGLLRNSDLIMWDHETESWWQQFTGQSIVGTMTGTQLTFVPSIVVSWGDFKAQFPEGQVLVNQAGHGVNGVSYANYDVVGNPFLFDGEIDERLFPTERVLGYFNGNNAVAYPLAALAEVEVVNDQLAGDAVVVIWQPGAVSLFSNDVETGSAALFDATLDDGTVLTFVKAEDGTISDEQTGSTWNIFGRATRGDLADTQLEPYIAHPHFWFAWAAFRPDTMIWEVGSITDEAWAN